MIVQNEEAEHENYLWYFRSIWGLSPAPSNQERGILPRTALFEDVNALRCFSGSSRLWLGRRTAAFKRCRWNIGRCARFPLFSVGLELLGDWFQFSADWKTFTFGKDIHSQTCYLYRCFRCPYVWWCRASSSAASSQLQCTQCRISSFCLLIIDRCRLFCGWCFWALLPWASWLVSRTLRLVCQRLIEMSRGIVAGYPQSIGSEFGCNRARRSKRF